MKEINVYYLQYCSKCSDLKKLLDKEGISYNAIDADVDIDQTNYLEELLDTNEYPIVEVKADTEVIYFVGQQVDSNVVGDNMFKEGYDNIQHLAFQIKNL